jgi:pimeloyl-ACP methyl ester carboxylesterase
MISSRHLLELSIVASAFFACAADFRAQSQPQFFRFAGAPCADPPPLHCPDADCPQDRVINPGPVVEMNTRRTYFLDYPCDLKPDEPVTFILSLHGAGSYGNWQRHYFPALDFVTKYRLVVATPNSPTQVWSPADDAYLENIVTSVVDQLGKQRVKAFWLVGHSQGGLTANRLLRTDFFRDRVDGWLSLSGGRLGPTPPIPASFFQTASQPVPGVTPRLTPADLAAAIAALQALPTGDFSFIFETGEHELGGEALPEGSPWAAKYGCSARIRRPNIVDTKPGYVWDPFHQNPGSDSWGHLPRPGSAEILEYSGCKGGRVVADAIRLGKGHTEGLEPNITGALIQLMLSARGGKIQHLR